jgi:hypothetical protein
MKELLVKTGDCLKSALLSPVYRRTQFSTLLIYLLSVIWGYSQDGSEHSYRFIFYNVENFFDTFDDTLREDNDFLNGGTMRWNYTRYLRKLNSIYKVIIAAGEWSPPAVIGFCEVESRMVLEDMIKHTYLSKYDYGIIHEDSNDPRGIDVCLIYRKDLVEPVFFTYLIPQEYRPQDFKTRSVLYVKLRISGYYIHLFLNHWPSRRGGVLAGESLRAAISGMLINKTDSIQNSENGLSRIIIAGDFNSVPSDDVIRNLTGGVKDPAVSTMHLTNLTEYLANEGQGTYRYRGIWEMFDQVIVSELLLNSKSGIYTGYDQLHIFKPDFLLRKDRSYPGFTTNPTYVGYRYFGGYSDHLPVIIDLKVNPDP